MALYVVVLNNDSREFRTYLDVILAYKLSKMLFFQQPNLNVTQQANSQNTVTSTCYETRIIIEGKYILFHEIILKNLRIINPQNKKNGLIEFTLNIYLNTVLRMNGDMCMIAHFHNRNKKHLSYPGCDVSFKQLCIR